MLATVKLKNGMLTVTNLIREKNPQESARHYGIIIVL